MSDTPYLIAQTQLGVREIPGKKHHPAILRWLRLLKTSVYDDETPWCSTFVNYCALTAGYERSGKLNARSWLDVGTTVALAHARRGDVVIFSRGTSNWEGHVAFFVSYNSVNKTILCLGGNQSDSVCHAVYSTRKLLGIRRLAPLNDAR